MQLTCNSNGDIQGTVNWKAKGTELQSDSHYELSSGGRTLTVKGVTPSDNAVTCDDNVYGFGKVGDIAVGQCGTNEVGSKTAKCGEDGKWKLVQNNCVLRVFQMLKEESQDLDTNTIKEFVMKVTNASQEHVEEVATSPGTVATIITLLNTIADVSQNIQVDQVVIEDFLQTLDVITSPATKETWIELNDNTESKGNSSLLLMSLENIFKSVSDDVPDFTTNTTEFRRATISNEPFKQIFGNDSIATIFISNTTLTTNVTITSVAFFNLNFVLPARNDSVNETSGTVVNGIIVLVSVNKNDSIHNTTLTFRKLNTTGNLANADCVFWNFDLFNAIGGWDSFGCKRKSDLNGVVTCECNHTTSFSILMSPGGVDSAPLSIITYVGVAVSMASLVLFLLIEAIFWKPITRGPSSPILYLRHISLVNIAVSLLIANIWFIIGAAISESAPTVPIDPCSAAAFFIHFFYLALFFWMLVSALLLLYSILVVFSRMSKSAMMAIAFCVGYGAPLIISVVTVASTAGGETYIIKEGRCWLNWKESKAQLAFIIPALTIVFINFLVMVVVLYKMLRKRVGERSGDDKNAMTVIARFVAVLTPVFGITWGLGLGLMISPESLALHYLFAILNSLQGFFIAVLGTLFDKKVCVLMFSSLPMMVFCWS
ncbi:adhesion G-protein coupled receptor F1 [Colossoma macropomum]|uniref:adhesion G-protein coupled receptor F1 n=1 Tax=Colossoma macropomum TaxID=42526 RepID=UPI0018647CE6|nr:adhesion G-protein coupled receptor F1 [Colossoma macropomum]